MNKYHVLIKDASRGRFRVCQMGPNGEMINQSEPLETVDNVLKNILAGARVFRCKYVKRASQLRNESQRLIHVCQLSALYHVADYVYTGKNKVLKNAFN